MNNNQEFYRRLQAYALNSVYWGRKAVGYHYSSYYNYGPMIVDELFLSYFDADDVVGAAAMEARLGRRLKVEELKLCPLSVEYLLFGHPLITGSTKEAAVLSEFADIIENSVNRNEYRTVGYEIKRLTKLL